MVVFTLNHVLLTPESKVRNFLDDFLKNNKFSRLWIKTYAFDRYYADILNNQKPCDIRVLMDDVTFKSFSKKIRMGKNEFKEKYFPLILGRIHNKYIYFKTSDGLKEGVITGSYNLVEGSKLKDNDIIVYCKEYERGEIIPGFVMTFGSGKESVISSNIAKVKYDFTKSWGKKNPNSDLICPVCDSENLSDAVYCHKISVTSGAFSLVGFDGIGGYGDCEDCVRWCMDESITPKNINFIDENGESHGIFVCGECDTIFVDNGGIIGEDFVVSLNSIVDKKPEENKDDDKPFEGDWNLKFDETINF